MMQVVSDLFGTAQGWLFESLVQPAIYYLGFGAYAEDAFDGLEWIMMGMGELALLFVILRPLEALIPVQLITDSRARRTDFIYTIIHRLGVFPLLLFFTLDPLMDSLTGVLRDYNLHPINLENLYPGIAPFASAMLYLIVFDFFDYWYHRASHHFTWWWALHSLHHSQQDMNLWSDNRNHFIDDLLHDTYMALVALVIGVQPAQFLLLISVSRMLQSLQHANIRCHFGVIGERLLVSPRFHRTHHAIDIDKKIFHNHGLGGCNFGVLLPIWDSLFSTANFMPDFVATGIRDQVASTDQDGNLVPGKNYGSSFLQQQWLGCVRLLSAIIKGWCAKTNPASLNYVPPKTSGYDR